MDPASLELKDNPELLLQIVSDQKDAPSVFRPTNFWNNYVEKFTPYLVKHGLKNFRSRKNSLFCTFGGTDLKFRISSINLKRNRWFFNSLLKKIPYYEKFLDGLNTFLGMFIKTDNYLSKKDLDTIHFRLAKAEGIASGAKSIDQLQISESGSPEDIFLSENGLKYTTSMLVYYTRYAWVNSHINFDKINHFVELGSGSGKQIEILKKFYPYINFYVFDIAPQIYICEQYLKSVFGDDVVGYSETRKLRDLSSLQSEGKIYIFGSWDFPILKNFKHDLFWNAASFQEMEPEVVRNYLGYINESAKCVFLQEYMEGKEVADKVGNHGVIRKTVLNDYNESLSKFKMTHSRQAISFPRLTRALESVWEIDE